eukprot:Nitzschia sp. Nitz4//scaffold89_size161592//79860//81173//NITZ4_002381-RA/size161592-processed-gene-0.225-mRNA-1//-1//CDS//3329559625//8450//frame0
MRGLPCRTTDYTDSFRADDFDRHQQKFAHKSSESCTTMANPAKLCVVSRYKPETIPLNSNGEPNLDDASKFNDGLDDFNHPRYRRLRILEQLGVRASQQKPIIECFAPSGPASDLSPYSVVHRTELLEFLSSAWDRWNAMGEARDPMCTVVTTADDGTEHKAWPLIPGNVPLLRHPYQRASKNVMGQMGYYCTDTCTPVFEEMREELTWDVAVMEQAIQLAKDGPIVYALATHPGHHAAEDSFGGYCYLNHVAFAARKLQEGGSVKTVGIVDVDYHCGNGTASIFYEDPSVLVISIHCDPDHEYPFHSGFSDDTGAGAGEGATHHIPLLPGTSWSKGYCAAMEEAVTKLESFGVDALVISLGLDTHKGDPCALRRAGFELDGENYGEMGRMFGKFVSKRRSEGSGMPVVVVQEGGYAMAHVADAASDFLCGCSVESV